jgi:DNA-binding response OmpR family regulator
MPAQAQKQEGAEAAILIIEDNATFRGVFRDAIKSDGYTVIEASDADEGFKKIKTQHIDLVICDVLMPQKTGLQFLAEMKADQAMKDIPVILMSVLGEHEDIERGLKAGASDYLIKGKAGPNDVLSKIRTVLASHDSSNYALSYRISVNPSKYDGAKLAKDLGFTGLYICPLCGKEKTLELVPRPSQAGQRELFDARFVCECP